MKRILVIDPGTPFGFAVFWGKVFHGGGTCHQRLPTWEENANNAADQFAVVLKESKASHVYCETPTYFQGSGAAGSGALVKLCFMYGRFMQVAYDAAIPFSGVEVRAWKGQIRDPAVKYRLERVMGKPWTGSVHEMDAVAIGFHVLGLWPHDGLV